MLRTLCLRYSASVSVAGTAPRLGRLTDPAELATAVSRLARAPPTLGRGRAVFYALMNCQCPDLRASYARRVQLAEAAWRSAGGEHARTRDHFAALLRVHVAAHAPLDRAALAAAMAHHQVPCASPQRDPDLCALLARAHAAAGDARAVHALVLGGDDGVASADGRLHQALAAARIARGHLAGAFAALDAYRYNTRRDAAVAGAARARHNLRQQLLHAASLAGHVPLTLRAFGGDSEQHQQHQQPPVEADLTAAAGGASLQAWNDLVHVFGVTGDLPRLHSTMALRFDAGFRVAPDREVCGGFG
jgi:hypothetical protein